MNLMNLASMSEKGKLFFQGKDKVPLWYRENKIHQKYPINHSSYKWHRHFQCTFIPNRFTVGTAQSQFSPNGGTSFFGYCMLFLKRFQLPRWSYQVDPSGSTAHASSYHVMAIRDSVWLCRSRVTQTRFSTHQDWGDPHRSGHLFLLPIVILIKSTAFMNLLPAIIWGRHGIIPCSKWSFHQELVDFGKLGGRLVFHVRERIDMQRKWFQ